jgi:hypothetical protein
MTLQTLKQPTRRRMLGRLALLPAAAAAPLLLSGCAGPQVTDYADQSPKLDLREYFNGTVDAWGMFTDRSGAVVKRFKVVMDCKWTGNEGVLDEASPMPMAPPSGGSGV